MLINNNSRESIEKFIPKKFSTEKTKVLNSLDETSILVKLLLFNISIKGNREIIAKPSKIPLIKIKKIIVKNFNEKTLNQ